MKKLPAIALAALTLTGCASESAEPAQEPSTKSSTTASATSSSSSTTSTTTPEPAVEQPETTTPQPATAPDPNFPYAPYGVDEYGIPNIPEGTPISERCHILNGYPCEPDKLSQYEQMWTQRGYDQNGNKIPLSENAQQEEDAQTRFWDCFNAGGTEEECRQ